jgi:hypothetical protein
VTRGGSSVNAHSPTPPHHPTPTPDAPHHPTQADSIFRLFDIRLNGMMDVASVGPALRLLRICLSGAHVGMGKRARAVRRSIAAGGPPDGSAVDAEGRIVAAAGAGVGGPSAGAAEDNEPTGPLLQLLPQDVMSLVTFGEADVWVRTRVRA